MLCSASVIRSPMLSPSEPSINASETFLPCLKSAGIVFIQMHNFDCVMQEKKRWMEPLALSRSGKEWVFMRFYDFEPNGYLQFNILTLEKEKHQPWKSQLTSTRLFPITSNLLDSALHESGFEDTSWYGSMAGDTFDNSASSDIVVIAKENQPLRLVLHHPFQRYQLPF